jgi:hypothetical protein
MDPTQNDSPVWADVPWWALALIFGPVYLLAILLGHAFFLTPNSIAALWPASGVAVAKSSVPTANTKREGTVVAR